MSSPSSVRLKSPDRRLSLPTHAFQSVDNQDDNENRTLPSAYSSAVPQLQLPVPLPIWRLILVFFVFLYSSFTIFVHLCQLDNGKLPFNVSASILLIELIKLILCGFLFARESHQLTNPLGLLRAVKIELLKGLPAPLLLPSKVTDHSTTKTALDDDPALLDSSDKLHRLESCKPPSAGLSWRDFFQVSWPFAIPALLYTVNNNLGVYIQSEMDPATYQMLGNFKVLTTALLFRLIIKRPLTVLQWFSLLLLLTAGFVHSYETLHNTPSKVDNNHTSGLEGTAQSSTLQHITVTGLLMVAVYCTISGLSGVYTEYVLKTRAQTAEGGVSLWTRLYLSPVSLLLTLHILNQHTRVLLVSSDPSLSSSTDRHALFHPLAGFTVYTWGFIFSQVAVGLLMGAVMKYASNITRLFVISSAMLVTTVLSYFIFALQLTIHFALCVLLVAAALYLYNRK